MWVQAERLLMMHQFCSTSDGCSVMEIRRKWLVWVSDLAQLCSQRFDWLFHVFFFSLEDRITDEELQQILDDIKTKRSFQY